MRYFPIFLDLTGKKIVVIGGGKIACEKVLTLLDSAAEIKVISPQINARLVELIEQGRILWEAREYLLTDLSEAFLVITATGEVKHSQEIFEFLEGQHKLVNAVDNPKHCNFIFPAIAKTGPVQVAVSSSGTSPALAQKIRNQIQDKILTIETGMLAKFLGDRRPIVKKSFTRYIDRELFWNAVIDSEIPEMISNQEDEKAAKLFIGMLEYYSGLHYQVQESKRVANG